MTLTRRWSTWVLAAVALTTLFALFFTATDPVRAFVRDTYGHWAAPMVTRFAIRAAQPLDEPFRPDAAVTRAELANLLVVAASLATDAAELQGITPAFGDVPSNHPLAPHTQVAFERGWLIGDGSMLEPDRPITRAELAVVLSRIYGLTPETPETTDTAESTTTAATVFRDDADIPAWARRAVTAAVARGLVNGFPDGTFQPQATATRAQAVTLLQAMLFQRSDAYTVIGPVEGYDGPSRTITIGGQSWPFAQGALLLRGDAFVSPFQLPPTDLLRAVADKDGYLVYAESTPLEDLAVVASLGPDPASLTATPLGFIDWQHWQSAHTAPRDGRLDLRVSADAAIFRNGQRAALRDLQPSDRLYVRRDARDDTVIAIDAVQVDVNGYIDVIEEPPEDQTATNITFHVTAGHGVTATLSPQTIVYIDGKRVDASELRLGDRVVVHLGPASGGTPAPIRYLEATR